MPLSFAPHAPCNQQKVLTLVLTLAMLLSVMVVGAGAAVFDDQDSIKNTQAVDVCTTLKIIDGINGSFKPNDNVTRAQMCKMICVALNGGNNANMGSNVGNTFADVTTGYWGTPFIEYCVREKVAAGVGGGNFNPEGNVTGSQAAKMLLVILGYDPAIQGYVGSNAWELNINSDAAKKGLYAGIESIDPSAPLSRDNAAQMIWNALQAYEVTYSSGSMILGPNGTMVPAAQDKVVGSTSDKISLLSDKYDANIAVGTFAGNGVNRSDLNSGECKITDAQINGRTIYDANNQQTIVNSFNFKSDFDLKYIGEEIMVLYKDGLTGTRGQLDTKDNVFGVFLTGASTVYNIAKVDLQDAPDGKNKIKFGDKEYDANAQIAVYENYKSTKTDKAVTAFDKGGEYYMACGDTIKFVAKDGKINAAYIVEYSIGRVTAISSEEVSISGISDSLRYVDDKIADGLERDSVVLYSNVYDSNTYIVEKATPVTGKLDAYNVSKGTVTVSGTTYDKDENTTLDGEANNHFNDLSGADSFMLLEDLTSNDLNTDVEAYVLNGCVLALRVVNAKTNYALIDSLGGTGSKVDPYKVYMILSDGTEKAYVISDDSTLKGDDIEDLLDADSTVAAAAGGGNVPSKVLVTYTFTRGEQVKLNRADVAADGTTTNAALVKVNYDKDVKSLFENTASKGIVAPNCVLFVRTKQADDKYKVYTNVRDLNTINKDKDAMYGLYGLDKDGKVVVAYIDLNDKPSGANANTMYGIVTSDGNVTNKDGVNYTTFNVYANNEPMTITFEGDDKQAGLPQTGSLIFFDKTSDGIYETKDIITVATDRAVLNASLGSVAPGVTANVIQVKDYSQKDQLLTYSTTATNTDGVLNWGTPTPVNVASDAVITYVHADGNKPGKNIGVQRANIANFDESTKVIAKNAVILEKENKIIAMFVDDSYNIEQ